MSPTRALVSSAILALAPFLLFTFASKTYSTYEILITSIIINWPIVRWLDDRQWYIEWNKENSKK